MFFWLKTVLFVLIGFLDEKSKIIVAVKMSKNKKNFDFEKVLENDKSTWKYAQYPSKAKKKLKGFTPQICYANP